MNKTRVAAGIVAVLLGVALIAGGTFSWYIGGQLIAPNMHPVAPPPPELNASAVTFHSESGSLIHAWYSVGTPGRGAVLILHGVGADRWAMADRAMFLHALGYAVLVIDFQAHGESPGKSVTVGDLESWDVVAAVDYLKHTLPDERIGVIAVSMGAAAVVLAKRPLALNAVVLESMYPTIEEALSDRMKDAFGAWGPALTQLLVLQLRPRLGISPSRLHPIDNIAHIGAPVLLIHGAEDHLTTLAEAKRVFAAAAEPKTFWIVPGAGHVDMHYFAPAEYESRVSRFLAEHIVRDPAAAAASVQVPGALPPAAIAGCHRSLPTLRAGGGRRPRLGAGARRF